jgi:3alpha(or 20beta)-hydroxysteroid dehydrogenase
MKRFDGAVAIVTGGARGQGAAEASGFAAEGAQVVIADIADAEGETLAEEIGAAARYRHLDVSDEQAWAELIGYCRSAHGRLDVLVNNAGITKFAPLCDTLAEDFDKVVRVNLNGCFLGIKHAAPLMAESGGGAIVNTSSVSGIRGGRESAAYTASKWAVRGLTRSAAADLAAMNIRVNAVLPGVIDTAMVRGPGVSDEELSAVWQPRLLTPRIGTPSDVTQAILFLASDQAGFITGADLVIDGGMTVPLRPVLI